MIICAAGDIHGALDRLYEDVLAFEGTLGVRFEWVLHVGDFGVWPDEARIDKTTRKHDGADDFPSWWSERRAAPRHTVFIKGNHEDFVWLDAQPDPEVLSNLFYLRNGTTFDLGASRSVVSVAVSAPRTMSAGRRTSRGTRSGTTPARTSTRCSRDDASISSSPTTHRRASCFLGTGAVSTGRAKPLVSTTSSAAFVPASASSATTTPASTRRSTACRASD